MEYSDDFEEINEPIRRALRRYTKNLKKLGESVKETHQKTQLNQMMGEIQSKLIQGGEELDKRLEKDLWHKRNTGKNLEGRIKMKKLPDAFKKQEGKIEIREIEYANMQDELEDLRKVSKQLKV